MKRRNSKRTMRLREIAMEDRWVGCIIYTQFPPRWWMVVTLNHRRRRAKLRLMDYEE